MCDQLTVNPEEIAMQIADACDRNRDALLGLVQLLTSIQATPSPVNERTEEIRRTQDEIKAKQFISPNEAAFLFGCSPQHLRNLVQRAIEGKTDSPIPFRDLDGVVAFPLAELLDWSRVLKRKRSTKRSQKNKSRLEVVAS